MSEIVVSTWAFGERANVPGWEILKTGGSALDAVVAGEGALAFGRSQG